MSSPGRHGPLAAVQGLVDGLRAAGVRISTAESTEAARALDLVDLADRRAVRAALRTTLAKTAPARETFDRVFDRYFKAPTGGSRKKRGKGRRPTPEGTGERREGPPRDEESSGRRPHAAPPHAALSSRRSPSSERKSERPAEPSLLARIRRRAGRRGRRPPEVVLSDASEEGTSTARRPSRHRGLPRTPLKGTRLRPVSRDEDRALLEAVPRLLASLPPAPVRRRAAAPRGRLWMRQAMRSGLRTGGIPFELPRRRPRLQRPEPLLLVDVSHSVRRSAGLFLMLAARTLQACPRARVLLFVDRPVDVTRDLRSRLARGPSSLNLEALLADLERDGRIRLDAPSDYGTAFYRLIDEHGAGLGRRATLVVLGDGRTNRFDPLPWAFEEAAGRCARVLWIVPEPVAEWGTGDSALEAYLPWADLVIEARELLDLGRAAAALGQTPVGGGAPW